MQIIVYIFTIIALITPAYAGGAPTDGDKRVVQTVQRLASFDYAKTGTKTKEAIDRYLTATAGDPEYFQFVEKHKVSGQTENLMSLAQVKAGSSIASQAIHALFTLGKSQSLKAMLTALPQEKVALIMENVAALGTNETTAFSIALIADPAAPLASLQATARGLGLNAAGQAALLSSAASGKVPSSINQIVAGALATSTDSSIREAAAKIIPLAPTNNLPSVTELIQLTGDATKGQVTFMTYCFACHQVNGNGIDFGPALSEIGTKLPKEALYDSILNPNAAVSFGFEGWEIKTNDGNTLIGIVTSETDIELAIKLPGGIVQKFAKTSITTRSKLPVSLMTPNLHTIIAQDDLVNLVEYLSLLKKKNE